MIMRFECNIFYSIFILVHLVSYVVNDDSVSPCPKQCQCKMLGQNRPGVDCTRQLLKDVPAASEWPKNIYSLDISMNQIKRIELMESNDELEYLDLASNKIENIEPNAFEHLSQLRGMDLSHNELKTLPKDLFMENLLTLNLSYNNIEILPNELLEKSTFLQELRLAHNPLRILDSSLFLHSRELVSLDLSAIDAIAIKDDLFHHLFDLNELDLSDNEFMLVPTVPLRSARKLSILRLNGNPIRLLDEHSFVKLDTLTELYLDSMPELFEIKEKTFSYLYNLRKISISNNPHLSYIDDNAFYGIFNRSWIAIKEVDFRANRLSVLSENTLPFCNLTTLDLRYNPWTCDCHLMWAKQCHLRPELAKGIQCANPSRLRGHELSVLDHQSIYCDHSQVYKEVKMMRLFIIVFVSFTLFFIGLMFVLFIKRDQVMRWWTDRRRGTGAIYYVKAHTNPIEPEM